jgi:protein involved in polysaccharide export with SLBB domain
MKFYKIVSYFLLFSIPCVSQTINQQYSIQQYSVTLNGGNFVPGVYLVSPAFRVLDVIKMAMDTFKFEDLPREIIVDGKNIDIFQYIYKNEESQNPPIKAGMQIFVKFPQKFVSIKGDIQNKINKIPIKQFETVQSLMGLLTLNPSADSSYVQIIRDQITTNVLKVDYLKTFLENNDFIVVPTLKSMHLPYTVQIMGEVERPGFYSIKHGVTRIVDILCMARPLPASNISKICIYRKINLDQIQSPRPEVASGLKNLSHQYITVCGDDSQILNDCDIIEISKFDSVVYVNGYVAFPKAIPFNVKYTVNDYIKSAGGLTKSSDKTNVRILTSCGTNFQVKDVKKIQPGDIIMVPEASESKWVKTWSPIISVIGSTASIIAALINISR